MTVTRRSAPTLLFGGASLLLLALAAVAARTGFLELSVSGVDAGELGRLLGVAILAAAAIERAVEVYVKNAFDVARSAVGRDVLLAQRRVAIAEAALTRETERQAIRTDAIDDAAVDARRDEVAAARGHLSESMGQQYGPLTQHQRKTAAGAAVLALVLSFAAAAVGVRLLGPFLHVDGSPIAEALESCTPRPTDAAGQKRCETAEAQVIWFRMVDIVITTLVLAGGADGVHQIIKRFRRPIASA